MSTGPPIHQESFNIKSFEVDLTHRLKMETLCSLFQEVASNHARLLGVGYQQLQERNLFWVLSRLLVKIERMPSWHETIMVETWPKGWNRLFALRDFVVSSLAGETLCKASSYWLMLDANTRRPVRPESFFQQIPVHDGHALTDELDKIALQEEHHKEIYTTQVRYTDLDHNWHVNNIQYIHWMLNCFPPDQFEQHPVRSFQINFLAESRYQDVLQLFCSQNPDAPASFIVTGKKSGDNSPSFSAKVAFSGALDTGIGS